MRPKVVPGPRNHPAEPNGKLKKKSQVLELVQEPDGAATPESAKSRKEIVVTRNCADLVENTLAQQHLNPIVGIFIFILPKTGQ